MQTTTTTTVRKKKTKGAEAQTKTTSTVKHAVGLLVTSELENAIEECKAKVARIAKDCRAKNRKFRDIEFDLENDQNRCLFGLGPQLPPPADVHRVTQIFDKPQFFVDGVDSNDIVQGDLPDCWFLSALSTVSTAPGLVEKFCVARDEKVGVYGFIFFRDNGWVTVIIDDLLYTNVPKYEELKSSEQELYHFDKDVYNKSARKGGKSLYFAKSGTDGETWVPLIEKAYAKLNGNYAQLVGGKECDAIEDLTGGVSTVLQSKDILDTDRFWKEELGRANKDRLFGCSFNSLDGTRSGLPNARVQGLIGGHAYSVLRAVECKGKRFVVLRNPWGNSEWTGRWSDGSKEWTQEWLAALPNLGHSFGDDGQFVMEYSDWLESFGQIDRTILFDSNWMMTSQWLQVKVKPLPAAWSYGDVFFTFTITGSSKTIIVLSQLDRRCWRDLEGKARWTMDFVVVKQGDTEPLAESVHSEFYLRSVQLEIELDPGTYNVYVRLDRDLDKSDENPSVNEWQLRKVSRIMTQRAKSQSIATNFDASEQAKHIPISLDTLIQQDFEENERKKQAENETVTTTEIGNDGTVTTTTTTTITKIETIVSGGKKGKGAPISYSEAPTSLVLPNASFDPSSNGTATPASSYTPDEDSQRPDSRISQQRFAKAPDSGSTSGDPPKPTVEVEKGKVSVLHDDPDTVFIGLRVYTHKDVPAEISGMLSAKA